MAKRDNGAGTVTQRSRTNPDGSIYKYWEGRITTGTGSDGRQKRRTVTAKTKSELLSKMREITRALEDGTYAGANRITVSEWMAEWYDTYEKRKVKPYTASAYRGIIKNHINPAIGHIRLQQLRNVDIQRFYNALLDGGLSAKTIKNIDAVLSKGLNDAIKQGLIVQNPRNINIELPKQQRREITPLTEAEIPLFLKAIDTDEHRNAYALSLFCGLREGECLGLSWDSVDLAKKQITIIGRSARLLDDYFDVALHADPPFWLIIPTPIIGIENAVFDVADAAFDRATYEREREYADLAADGGIPAELDRGRPRPQTVDQPGCCKQQAVFEQPAKQPLMFSQKTLHVFLLLNCPAFGQLTQCGL